MLVVIDYGISNIGSLINMLKRIGVTAVVSSQADEILQADRLILPGIGSFDAGMQRLYDLNLVDTMNRKVLEERVPVLGICLGMQLMAKSSDEGKLKGLGWLEGEVVRFDLSPGQSEIRIPHVGWNFIEQRKESDLFHGLGAHPKFYFVHSFHFKASHPSDVLCTTHHGYEFPSGVEKDNISGVQFHPEKSHKFGLQLLQNFVRPSQEASSPHHSGSPH